MSLTTFPLSPTIIKCRSKIIINESVPIRLN